MNRTNCLHFSIETGIVMPGAGVRGIRRCFKEKHREGRSDLKVSASTEGGISEAMPWTPLTFGKHEGKTLPQILFTDPDWFFWACEAGAFQNHGLELQAEAERIHAKATSIRIPQTGPDRLHVEYLLSENTSACIGLRIVGENYRDPAPDPLSTERADHIDLSYPRQLRGYDKGRYKVFISSFKHHYFGNASATMTRQRCEAFFDDGSNFHNNGPVGCG